MTAVDTHLLLRALVDELARCGLTEAVTSPGSRNTPIIEALIAESRVTAWSHIDERSGGFFAVGAARASGTPVAVTCTSGGAVANLMPAVVEASEAHLPLIILTADRPAELRQIGAGQTIDQVKLFGSYVRFFAELDVYEATPERMRWVRSLACRAFITALGPDAGPVHLNIPLREPLVVDAPLPADPPGGEGRAGGRSWVLRAADHRHADPTPESVTEPTAKRAVIVAGDQGHARVAPKLLARLAAQYSLPLLADPLSGARRRDAAIAHYDLILRDPATAEALRPDLVLRIGDLPTSKPLRAWLAGLEEVDQIVFHQHPVWPDPSSQMAALILSGFLPASRAMSGLAGSPAWLESWQAADASVDRAVSQILDGPELTEPGVARLLGGELPREATLFVAASMPIRDVEEFFPARDHPPRVLANRGANGIDGTVSSAFGAVAVSDGPVVLLIGDVALAHDIGGLLAAKRTGLKLTIVLINNDGGGIFNFLPIADREAAFTEHVATPHGLDFSHAAALYGFDHVTPIDVGGFMAALDTALHAEVGTIIEVRTGRAENRALHAEIAAAAAAALSRTGPAAVPGA